MVKWMEQTMLRRRLQRGEVPLMSCPTPLSTPHRQEEKMERKLIVTLIGIGLIVLVLWLSSGCSVVV